MNFDNENLDLFTVASEKILIDMIKSVMDHPDDVEEENRVWVERAYEFVETIIPLIVWMRDYNDTELSKHNLSDYCKFNMVVKLSRNGLTPENYKTKLNTYLNNLHGYEDKYLNDDGTFNDCLAHKEDYDTLMPMQQHGYRTMLLKKPMHYLGVEDFSPI